MTTTVTRVPSPTPPPSNRKPAAALAPPLNPLPYPTATAVRPRATRALTARGRRATCPLRAQREDRGTADRRPQETRTPQTAAKPLRNRRKRLLPVRRASRSLHLRTTRRNRRAASFLLSIFFPPFLPPPVAPNTPPSRGRKDFTSLHYAFFLPSLLFHTPSLTNATSSSMNQPVILSMARGCAVSPALPRKETLTCTCDTNPLTILDFTFSHANGVG